MPVLKRALGSAVLDTGVYTALTLSLLALQPSKLNKLFSVYYLSAIIVVITVMSSIFVASLLGVSTILDSIKWPLKGGGRDRVPGTLAVAVIVGFITSIVLSIYN
jgi:hypothetical protein